MAFTPLANPIQIRIRSNSVAIFKPDTNSFGAVLPVHKDKEPGAGTSHSSLIKLSSRPAFAFATGRPTSLPPH